MRTVRPRVSLAMAVSVLLAVPILGQTTKGLGVTTSAGAITTRSTTGPVQLQAVSCPTRLRCIAVGRIASGGSPAARIFSSVDGGHAWSSQAAPTTTNGLTAVSCATASRCLAMGSPQVVENPYPVFIRTVDGGSVWAPVPQWDEPAPPTCLRANVCVELLGGALYRSMDGGLRWAPLSMRGWSYIDGISCLADSTCFVVGYGVPQPQLEFGELAAGGTRIQRIAPMPFRIVATPELGVACPSASSCMVGIERTDGPERVLTTADGGERWAAHSLPTSFGQTSSLACPEVGHCVLAGGAYVAVTTSNDARTWTVHNPAPLGTSTSGEAVSCAAASACVVVWGDTAFVGSNALQTWTAVLV